MTTQAKLDTPSERTVEAPSIIFDLPKLEIPTAFQDIAAKGVDQARENCVKLKNATEAMTALFQESYSAGTRGATAYNLRLIKAAHENITAGFDFMGLMMTLKSPSDMATVTTNHARKQFDAILAQGKELADLAQKAATETTEPMKGCVTKMQPWTGGAST